MRGVDVRRSGVTDVIFPLGNQREYEEVPEDLKAGMTPHFVDSYEQVFGLAFPGLKGFGGSSSGGSSSEQQAGSAGGAAAAAAAAAPSGASFLSSWL
jgi:hypothetical protein